MQAEGVELFSGDLVQFGEDVDDNYCIRASVRLLPEEGETDQRVSKSQSGWFALLPYESAWFAFDLIGHPVLLIW